MIVANNLPFREWTKIFGQDRLTGALLDRLTHPVHILEMNGESYGLKHRREKDAFQAPDIPQQAAKSSLAFISRNLPTPPDVPPSVVK